MYAIFQNILKQTLENLLEYSLISVNFTKSVNHELHHFKVFISSTRNAKQFEKSLIFKDH